MSTNGTGQDVFVGGDVDLAALADTDNTSALLATGVVGLYSQVEAIEAAAADGSLSSIVAGMANTGPGQAEINLQNAQYALAWFQDKWQSDWLDYGLAPTSINVNIDYTSPTWETDFAATVTAAHSYGVTSIAPIFSPNAGTYSLEPFATNPAYADLRAAAIEGGALAIDSPPAYFFLRGEQYQDFIYGEIQWAQDNDLRTTVIISPHGDDANFLGDSEDYIDLLQWHDATPTDWVIENYTPSDPNGVGSDTDPNSIAGVALWVAQNAPTRAGPNTAPEPTPTVTFNQPPTAHEVAWGSGVTITDTITTTYLAGPVYVGVETSAGNIETPAFSTIELGLDGSATFTVTLEHSLDSVVVENNLSGPAVSVQSSPVTFTEPMASFTLTAPGTISVAPYGAGGTATGIVHAVNVVGSMVVADVSSTGVIDGPFETVTLDADGNGAYALLLADTGDRVLAEVYPNQPAGLAESAPVTLIDPAIRMTLGAPGTVQEAAYNAGVTVTESIATTSMVGPVFIGVATSAGVIEGAFQTVALGPDGTASFSVDLEHNGDYVIAESDLANPALLVTSAPVTITEPPIAFTLTDPGTITIAPYGAGGTAHGSVHAVDVVGSMVVADVSATGVINGAFETVALDASGNGTYALFLADAGDRVLAEVSANQPAGMAESAPVSFADAAMNITLSAPGTLAEASFNAGVDVTETVTTTSTTGPIYVGVATGAGAIEGAGFQTVDLGANGAASFDVHLAHNGDYIIAESDLSNPALLVRSAPVTIVEEIPCFVEGTLILTPGGTCPVQALRPGDRVMTSRSGYLSCGVVRWTGHRRVACCRHPSPEQVHPIRVCAGAFDDGVPVRDLWLSPDHAVHVDDVLIPIKLLVNGASIRSDARNDVTYWHVELAHHDVLLAEGLPCESYLDTGNRAALHGGGDWYERPRGQAPARALTWADACAELVQEGARLVAVKQRLALRAGALTLRPVPTLQFFAGDQELRPQITAAGRWHVQVPRGAQSLQLRVPAWVPAHCDAASLDRRLLGARVFGVELDGVPLELESAALHGFHPIEATAEGPCRWTSGDAAIVLERTARRVKLHLDPEVQPSPSWHTMTHVPGGNRRRRSGPRTAAGRSASPSEATATATDRG